MVYVKVHTGTEAQKCKNSVFYGTVNKLFQEQAKRTKSCTVKWMLYDDLICGIYKCQSQRNRYQDWLTETTVFIRILNISREHMTLGWQSMDHDRFALCHVI